MNDNEIATKLAEAMGISNKWGFDPCRQWSDCGKVIDWMKTQSEDVINFFFGEMKNLLYRFTIDFDPRHICLAALEALS